MLFLEFCGAWTALYLVLSAFDSAHLIMDNTISVIFAAANLGSLLYLIEQQKKNTVQHNNSRRF